MKTIAFLSLAGLCRLAAAQTPAMTTLQIDMANQRAYVQDIPDPQKYASDPTAVATSGFRIFASIVNLMDIVAVNGKPAKGTFVARTGNPCRTESEFWRGNWPSPTWNVVSHHLLEP
jgi:hypothetical protein